MDKYIEVLAKSFKLNADSDDAGQIAAYMKNRLKFFGIKAQARRELSNDFVEKIGLPEFRDLETLVLKLFDLREREFHHFAIEVCGKYKSKWQAKTISLFEKMAVTNSWWDSVDSINIFCIRPYFAMFPEYNYSITQSWIDSKNIWLQRLSIICQLRLTDKTDKMLLSRNIRQLAGSDEFFVQKAIGWALRDYWRTEPEWVKAFVKKSDLKPLSKREALKYV